MSLSRHYRTALQQPDMVEDAAQRQAVNKLEMLSHTICTEKKRLIPVFPAWLLPFVKPPEPPLLGLYIWGSVGRGKTWLMNLFYEELPINEKCRIHFHHFMLDIHEKLGLLNRKKNRNQKNPLQTIARELAGQYKVLCIDEFIVTNITDAMILSELLDVLFKHRVYLVATSNRTPDDLYINGLQRERFLPAIELIKNRMDVFHLDGGVDHRTALLEQADVYYCPVDDNTRHSILQRMQELAITPVVENASLNILNREIKTIYCSEEIAWFDFDTICSAPRAAQDYIELARQFNTLIITDIPVMDEYSDDKARRFIYLIDELYDRNVKVIASALAQPERLYHGNMLEFAFHRTSSRLIEMRSHQYLSKQHKPF